MSRERLAERLHGALREEDGNIIVLSVATITVILLVIMPIVMNVAMVSTTRRFSQNGSDAAALAGAEEVARALSAEWTAKQCVPPATDDMIAEEYVATRVYPVGSSGVGYGAASEYAARNRSELGERYGQHVGGPHPERWGRVVVPSVVTQAHAGAVAPGTFAPSIYSLGDEVSSVASAEAFFVQAIPLRPRPCPEEGGDAVHPRFRFVWNVRIIDDPRD